MKTLYLLLDRAWQAISGTIFVRFQYELPLEAIRERPEKTIFALTHGSLVEWLILSSWCRSQGLGAILITNRKRILFLSKPKYFFQILFRNRKYSDLFLSSESGPRLLFCPPGERKKLSSPVPVEELISEVFTVEKMVLIVPVLILWRRHLRGAARRIYEYWLGSIASPNTLGKCWYLFRKRGDSLVRALTPFRLAAESNGESDLLEEGEAMRVAKTARRRILVTCYQEMRVILGPLYHRPVAVKESILKDPDMQMLMETLSKEEGVDRKQLMGQGYRYLTELVADYSFQFIEGMYFFLKWTFSRVFEGLSFKEKELHEIREIMKTKSVVFVCAHRSHFDYLVVPYVLFLHQMVTPHIAAGVNLSFWPLGRLLRRSGAFFIRRSFKGNALYSMTVRKYVEFLLAHRFNIQFFIEGTRSRSGKVLPPAYGILKMVMEAYVHGVCEDIALVPVSISYDEVPEQGSYTKELSGGEKTKESASALLRSRRVTRRKLGKVYLRFGQPLLLQEVVGKEAKDLVPLQIQKTAFRICKEINAVTAVTPKSLLAAVLLSEEEVSRPELMRLSELLASYVEETGYRLSVPRGTDFQSALELAFDTIEKVGAVHFSKTSGNCVLDRKKRLLLSFYRNNAMHCLVYPAVLSLSVLLCETNPESEAVFETAKEIRDLLKFEFFFSPTAAFKAELELHQSFFVGKADRLDHFFDRFGGEGNKRLFPRMLGDIFESYQVFLEFLRDTDAVDREVKGLAQKALAYAQTKGEGSILFPESLSVQLYSGAVKFFDNKNWLKRPWDLDMETQRQEFSSLVDLVAKKS